MNTHKTCLQKIPLSRQGGPYRTTSPTSYSLYKGPFSISLYLNTCKGQVCVSFHARVPLCSLLSLFSTLTTSSFFIHYSKALGSSAISHPKLPSSFLSSLSFTVPGLSFSFLFFFLLHLTDTVLKQFSIQLRAKHFVCI